MLRRRFFALTLLTLLFAGISIGQGPLTNALNLMVRTSTGGDLMVYGVAVGAQGPLTNFGNIRLRTYGSGDLGVAINGGTITPDCVVLDATNQDWSLCRSAANLAVIAAGDSLDVNPAGVRLSTDGDGALTLLGLGNGNDESLVINLDDSSQGANVVEFTSTSGATRTYWDNLTLETSGNMRLGAAGTFAWTGRSFMVSPADGEVSFQNSAQAYNASVRASYAVEANTGAKSPSALESREVFTNTGDADGSSVTLLNDPTVGISYSVVVTAAQTITITASSGETLKFGTSTCGTSLTSNSVGSAVTITASTGGSGAIWVALSSSGTWVCNA